MAVQKFIAGKESEMKHLILGGTRSGKSEYAEQLAKNLDMPVLYIATGIAVDNEMQRRITLHQERRPDCWNLVEEPIQLARVIRNHGGAGLTLLIDCLTIWLTNLLMKDDKLLMENEIADFLSVFEKMEGGLILVSNETGLGVLPMGELTRRYADSAGLLHQEIAKLCDTVTLVVAGLPLILKGKKE